jgi:hypothetical protein
MFNISRHQRNANQNDVETSLSPQSEWLSSTEIQTTGSEGVGVGGRRNLYTLLVGI